jgi:hypothetical protein
MRAGVAVIMVVTCFFPGLARTQPETKGADIVPEVSVHPDIMTVMQLPDTVVRARTLHRDEFRVGFFASRIYVQPRSDTPAGTEALLEVETRTQQRTIRLRVVEHAADAAQVFPVRAPEAEHGAPDTQPVAPPEAAPTPSTPPSVPGAPEQPRLPDPDPASAVEPTASADPRTTPAAHGRPLALSIHAVVALAGATEIESAGYEPEDARQPHHTLGVRLAAAPRDDRWSLEASISGAWPAAPTRHSKQDGEQNEPLRHEALTVSGPSLLAEVGMRARFGITLMPTAYAALGLRAHFREVEAIITVPGQPDEPPQLRRKEDMPLGGVLTLGLGLQYRAGGVLLGLDLHLRQGVPADYRSVEAALSVGFCLDRGE